MSGALRLILLTLTLAVFAPPAAATCDARGNVINNGKNSFAYDLANQPITVGGAASATYAYDGNLKRVKEVRGGKTIYTIYSRVTGGLVYRDEATDNIKTDYAALGPTGLRIKKVRTAAATAEFEHLDHQGSPVAATSAAAATTTIAWREAYRPFGRPMNDPAGNLNNVGYTGHLYDKTATGLVYMQARYYDPLLGRFYSTDPIGYQDQLNLYAYVANDPVNKIDPTGLCGTGSRLGESSGCKVEFDFAHSQRVSENKAARASSSQTSGSSQTFEQESSGQNNRFISTERLVEPDLLLDTRSLIQDPGEYLACSADCASEVSGVSTIVGAGLAISGQNFISTRAKFSGATPGTSPASLAARKVFGEARSPVPLPAPTLKAPFALSNRIGTVVGRGAPIVGYGLLINDARSLDYCVASCLRPPE